jgi:hypothetical protein
LPVELIPVGRVRGVTAPAGGAQSQERALQRFPGSLALDDDGIRHELPAVARATRHRFVLPPKGIADLLTVLEAQCIQPNQGEVDPEVLLVTPIAFPDRKTAVVSLATLHPRRHRLVTLEAPLR